MSTENLGSLNYMGYCEMIIVATLGFDERPVLHAISETGFRGIEKIFLIRPFGDDPRAVKAVSEIKKLASIANLSDEDVVSYRVDVGDFWGSVAMIHMLLREVAKNTEDYAVLCLGGGLRALVLETYTGFILLPLDERKKFRVRIDLETGDYVIILRGEEMFLDTRVSSSEIEVLETLREEPGLTLTEVSDKLVKPTSTIHRVLKKLCSRNLVVRKENKYYLSPAGESLLKILETQS